MLFQRVAQRPLPRASKKIQASELVIGTMTGTGFYDQMRRTPLAMYMVNMFDIKEEQLRLYLPSNIVAS